MATTETMQMPALGAQGEPCAECGAPLAADQRYCLNCGQRRVGPRVDYRQHLTDSAGAAGPPPPQEPQTAALSPEPKKPERDYAPLAAVGGIAVLGLMLLVGVLIGKGNSTTTSAPAPVVRVGGAATGAATTSTDSAGTADSKKASSAGSSKTGATKVNGGLTGSAARNAKQPVQATTNDLNNLNSQSGDSYENTIKKLPDKIATPGKPPPIDKSKAPGGGGGAVTIK
jgi:hypothetical protein